MKTEFGRIVKLWESPSTAKDKRILALKTPWWKPRGLSKLNPLAWWRYYKLKRHLVGYWPMDDEEPTGTPS